MSMLPSLGNAHSRTRGSIDAYSSDSWSSSGASEVEDPNPRREAGGMRTLHWRKRRRTGKEARDEAALGVFGSDSEYEHGAPLNRHHSDIPLRSHKMGFVKAADAGLTNGNRSHLGGGNGGDIKLGMAEAGREQLGEGHLRSFSPSGRRTPLNNVADETAEVSPRPDGFVDAPCIWRAPRGLGVPYTGDQGRDSCNLLEEQEWPSSGVGRSLGAVTGTRGTALPGRKDPSPAVGKISPKTSTSASQTPNLVTSRVSPLKFDHQDHGQPIYTPMVFKSPLGQGFIPPIAHQSRSHSVPLPQFQDTPPLVTPRPSFTDVVQHSRRIRGTKHDFQPYIPDVNTHSFAARMMARMGYVPGRGLGSEGQGILTPIEVKPRPQGLGVGAIREKTEQAKAEAKRAAFLRGDPFSGSEDEKEPKAGKTKNKATAAAKPKGILVATNNSKPIYRTVDEIQKCAVDLMVPSSLKSVVDMTGPRVKVLCPHSGLFIKTVPEAKQSAPEDAAQIKVAHLARRDLETFVTEWQRLQENKSYTSQEERNLSEDVHGQTAQVQRLDLLLELMKRMTHISISGEDSSESVGEYRMQGVVEQLLTLQFQFKNEVEVYNLSELSVAAIAPAFKQCMAVWKPLTDPFFLTELLQRLRSLLKIKSRENIEARYHDRGYLDQPSNTATTYESLIYSFWLPKVRSAINKQWDAHEPSPVITLLEAWDSLLPSYIHAYILNHLVMPRLRATITEWNPRLQPSRRKRATATLAPHIWVFPWLSHLNTQMLLPSLLSDIKSKFSILLSSHPLNSGPIEGMPEWTELLGTSATEMLFIRHLLPRLAFLLRSEFSVNPAHQDLIALETVWRWKDGFKVSTLGQLLQTELFPKWHATLYLWLTTPGVLLGEVSEWYRFWQAIIPVDVRESPIVRSQFDKGLDMINLAMDLGPGSERARQELPGPDQETHRPIEIAVEEMDQGWKEKTDLQGDDGGRGVRRAVLFKDAIEDWCTENNLLLIPLRRSDETSGQPLFRITASASGIGGLIVYFRDDVVWAQDNNVRGRFEPVGLDIILRRVGTNPGRMEV